VQPNQARTRFEPIDDYSQNAASLLIEAIEAQKNLMIAVATGGPRIQEVNSEYQSRRKEIRRLLKNLELEDPNPYEDLWAWYAAWKSSKLETYMARRRFIREMYSSLIAMLENVERGAYLEEPLQGTGWERVDRCIYKMRAKLASSSVEEDFQQVGLLRREVMISLAQAVYDPNRHKSVDDVKPSDTDADRMLAAYIMTELSGKGNEELRVHLKASLKLAVSPQHKRTADHQMAAICFEATRSVVNIIAIVSGRKDIAQTT
jgi:hypothetical protein